ncbi:hypothetical protein [Tenacibaculum sp. 190524A02b]
MAQKTKFDHPLTMGNPAFYFKKEGEKSLQKALEAQNDTNGVIKIHRVNSKTFVIR